MFKYKAYTPKSKGGGGRKSNRRLQTASDNSDHTEDRISISFQERRHSLKRSKWFNEVESIFNSLIAAEEWPVPKRIVALGLGSFESNSNALDQLVVLEWLTQRLQINSNRVTVFDPVSTEFDVKFLDKFGFKHGVDGDNSTMNNTNTPNNTPTNTLLYMPHCDKSLYEETLKSYWNPQSLPCLVLLGNDLSLYSQRQKDTERKSLVTKFLTFSQQSPLPTPPEDLLNSFNELCVQYLPRTRCEWLSGGYWEAN